MTSEKIAIVGLGCRLPGDVNHPEQLVHFLDNNGDGVCDIPRDRWDIGRFYSPNEDAPGRSYVQQAGFLKRDIFSFDPSPFFLSPREAEVLDPQQRILLEASWDALEDAGIPIQNLRGSATGVYVGAFMLDARDLAVNPHNLPLMGSQLATGVSNTVLSNRLSYTYDFRGPSLTVDTACSSSLVAIHLACRDLIEGSCSLAVAGGVNVMLSPASSMLMCKGKFLARDGRSKSFDAAADGYGRGEGASVIVLKKLNDAIRDGDRIYATILATGVNQDGRTDGMPMPNPTAQLELAQRVAKRAGINPQRLAYVEAHGTGTLAGDPIEIAALAGAYCGQERTTPLAVGSIKSNIGHLEAAAGITGLMKAALSLHHNKLFPLRALDKPNPAIPFDQYQIRVPVKSEPWPEQLDRTAAVNSFGYGGTNAHAILEAAPRVPALTSVDESQNHPQAKLLPISAYDDGALRQKARDYQTLATANIDSLAATLAHHRSHLPVRATLTLGSPTETAEALRALENGAMHPRVQRGREGEAGKLLWVFTGMGPQWSGMGQQLLLTEPIFRETAKTIDAVFSELAGFSLLAEMQKSDAESQMDRNRIAQPANFIIQAGLVAWLRQHGLAADGYLGHSVGELTAAWASGCLSLEQATIAAFYRSQLQDQVAGQGTMLAISQTVLEAEVLCEKYGAVDIAAINSPSSVVLSGARAVLEKIEADLSERKIFAKFMRVEVAYHSRQMDQLQQQFMDRLAVLKPSALNAPNAPLYSTALGQKIVAAQHDAAYWWQNARGAVQLQAALELALRDGYDGFLEIGPHPVLAAAINENARNQGKTVRLFSTLKRKEQERVQMLGTLGNLHCAGFAVDWNALAPRVLNASRCNIPAYPFQLKRHWLESIESQQYRSGRPEAAVLLDQWNESAQTWTTELDDARFPWLAGHRVLGSQVFPGAGYIDLALAAARETLSELSEYVVEDLSFHNALVIPETGFAVLSASLSGEKITISGKTEAGMHSVASARITGRSRYAPLDAVNHASLIQHMTVTNVDALYAQFEKMGLSYSGDFRAIQSAWVGQGEAVAELRNPSKAHHMVYPATLDGAFQLLLACLPELPETAFIPVRAESARWLCQIAGRVFCHVSVKKTDRGVSAQVRLFNEDGKVTLVINGLECEPVEKRKGLKNKEELWFHDWHWVDARLNAEKVDVVPWVIFSESEKFSSLVQQHLSGSKTPVLNSLPATGAVHVILMMEREKNEDDFTHLNTLLTTAKALAQRGNAQLTLLTQGAYSLHGEPAHPAHTAIAGMARVVMTELTGLRLRILDLPVDGEFDPTILCSGIALLAEEEAALRGNSWHGLRYQRSSSENKQRRAIRRPQQENEVLELYCQRPGDLNSLLYRPRILPDLADDEVEIAVEATSVNFKDVMKGMGMLDATALHRTYAGSDFGLEAAGRVVAVGSAVNHIRPGDLVSAMVGRSYSTRLQSKCEHIVVAAKGHTAIEASTYLVFHTVWHGLVERAGIQHGERILIHSAAGGLGMAAIQLAQHFGAEIFATAGTAEKREYLRNLGIKHVFDSRTLDFVEQIRLATSGQGVDLVLNSLAGEPLRRSFELLRAGGRFVEVGKQDISKGRELSLLPFNAALSFIAVDTDRMCFERPDLHHRTSLAVVRAFEEGIFKPLPTKIFSADKVSDAFRTLGSGAHIGKIVIDFSQGVAEVAPGMTLKILFRKEATYLITGGLGGFGMKTAEWIMRHGAGRVVLAGRRGQAEDADAIALAHLSDTTGCAVEYRSLDVTAKNEVAALIQELAQAALPLKGVFHSAMILDDHPLRELDAESIQRVMLPKALGAYHLHQATQSIALDHFVMYSSVSSLVGNPGQASYAAANAYLDGLAALRRSLGLPATSINWGALAQVGVVARDSSVEQHLKSIGITPLDPSRALLAMGIALQEDFSNLGIMDIDWGRWMRSNPDTSWLRLEELVDENAQSGSLTTKLLKELAHLDEQEQHALVLERLTNAVAPVFRLLPNDFDKRVPLKDYGLDSLLALEVQIAIENAVGIEFSSMEILAGRPLTVIASTCLERLMRSKPVDGSSGLANVDAPIIAPITAPTSTPRLTSLTKQGDLSDYFLERICVQRPYFALHDIQVKDDGLSAIARPVLPIAAERSAVSVAEAARHLAILGSCACRLGINAADGRVYFPVKSSLMHEENRLASLPQCEEVRLFARSVEVDEKRSIARATTLLYNMKDELVCGFDVEYHIIAEDTFKSLFQANAQATNEASAHDPYAVWPKRSVEQFDSKAGRLSLGRVSANECLGHFVGYPAYPVSIMLRDAFALAVRVIEAKNYGNRIRLSVVGGRAGTERFIFAGQKAFLQVVNHREEDGHCIMRIEIHDEQSVAAWFEIKALVEIVAE